VPDSFDFDTPHPLWGTRNNDKEIYKMKNPYLSEIFRRGFIAIGCFMLFASASSPAFASARTTERPITDADVERYLPRLRSDAAAMESAMQKSLEASAAIESKVAKDEKFYADIQSGKTDVLVWIRQHTEFALIPPGAVYSAECSRTVTGDSAVPTAIFTLGKESPYRDLLRRATAGDAEALAEYQRLRGEEEIGERNATAQAIYDLVAKTISFYKDHGFVETEGIDRPVIVTWLVSPDPSVFVSVWDVNPYAGVLPRNTLPTCAALPTGPMIEIELKAIPEEEAPIVAEAEGLPDPEYERVREALIMARIDAADTSALTIEIPPDAPPAVKAELASLQAEFAVRLANVAVYRRHEAVLAPILEKFLRTADQ
jgi:hypothetical protein